MQEEQMKMKVPRNPGQTLDPGCGQGVGSAGITAFTRYGYRAACGCWAAANMPTVSEVSQLISPGD